MAAPLDNADINPANRLYAARELATPTGLAVVVANDEEIVYKITFDLPNLGLGAAVITPDFPACPMADASLYDMTTVTVDVLTNTTNPSNNVTEQQYLSISCRSVVRHQPYNSYAPRTTFLQLGEVRMCRSVLDTKEFAGMTKEERILVTTYTEMKQEVDKMKYIMDPNLITDSENEMKV